MKLLADTTSDSLFGTIQPPPGTPAGNNALGDFMSLGVRLFFLVAGITTTIYLLRGAFAWITSGGDKEKLQKAQAILRNAIVGLLVIFLILAILVTLEDTVLKGSGICFGIRKECPIKLPKINP